MWKNYYQRRYFHLIKGIYQASRHVSSRQPTSVWIAFKGGIAASLVPGFTFSTGSRTCHPRFG